MAEVFQTGYEIFVQKQSKLEGTHRVRTHVVLLYLTLTLTFDLCPAPYTKFEHYGYGIIHF